MNKHRNRSCILLVLLASLPFSIAAQDYPNKIVRIVVPFPAGGSTDVLARMAAQKLNEAHGQNFIVEDRPGATGTIASAFVAKSAPDGYTVIMHSVSTYMAGYLYRKLPYDGATAFAPVINCVVNPFILVSAATLPAKNVKELIALAKRHPTEVTYGTVGRGSGSHMVAEMFNTAAGIKTVPVAYKGSTPAMVALASGEVGFSVNNILDVQSFVRQGKMRALAVTSAKRSPAVSDVPTLIESGVNVEANLWTGLFAPQNTNRAAIAYLNGNIGRIWDTADMKSWLLTSLGGEFTPNTPEQFASFIATDATRWQKIIKQMDLHLD
ncbi:MAG TPA: tripartite tricarboxylate transporter substrate binding protein [Burkholderiales bacterium]|nr:tripartite tricarboxylate transporter substrate binding protein [Burkholderiales bacterium]